MKEFYSKIKNILFIDVETVSLTSSYKELDDRLKPLWDKKSSYMNSDESSAELYFQKAGIYAEFGKIITIAAGFFYLNEKSELTFKVKSFASKDEKEVLTEFKNLIETKYKNKKLILCAHNGKEFDYPYICRRMLINNMIIPKQINLSGKKSWEVDHLDTLEMWKFGDRKNFTSLELLASIFGIPSSKDGLDGSLVNNAFYKEDSLEKIARYCENDVLVTAQVFLKLNNQDIIPPERIIML